MKNVKGFAVGTTVAFNKGLEWLYPRGMNVIMEVKDVRLMTGGCYVYTLGSTYGQNYTGVIADDIHAVG